MFTRHPITGKRIFVGAYCGGATFGFIDLDTDTFDTEDAAVLDISEFDCVGWTAVSLSEAEAECRWTLERLQ